MPENLHTTVSPRNVGFAIPRQIEVAPYAGMTGIKPTPDLMAYYDRNGRLLFVFDSVLELDLIVPAGDEPVTADDLATARREDPFADDDGHTYFIGGDVGAIKIGRSVNVAVRLKDIQACSPIPVRLLALRPGCNREKAYHHRFAAHRLHGEWFERHPDILAEIERLNADVVAEGHAPMIG